MDPLKEKEKLTATRERIKELCSEFLGGFWSELQSEEVNITAIENGKSNRIFAVSLPESLKHAIRDEPFKVLVRLYGSEWTGEGNRYKMIGDSAEAVVFALLAERNIGPKLYGVFEGGRIEEYIESRPLTISDTMNRDILRNFARKIAAIHCMKMPIPKKNVTLSAFSHLFENASKVKVDTSCLTEKNRHYYEQIMKFDFKKEYEFMKSVYTSTTQKLTFCHNDINVTNILLTIDENENSGKNFTIIDYENCFFNYRGIDIGKFFAECMHENNQQLAEYPSDDEIEYLIQEYLKELKLVSEDFNEKIDNEETLLLEVNCGRLLTHIFTSLWNMVHPNFSDEKFNVFENTVLRISLYKQLKEKFLLKYPQFNN